MVTARVIVDQKFIIQSIVDNKSFSEPSDSRQKSRFSRILKTTSRVSENPQIVENRLDTTKGPVANSSHV